MSKFEPVLKLSVEDLKLRRQQLKDELKKTVIELTFTGLRKELKEKFEEYGITNASSVSWDFYYESDDEGGTDPYLEYITIHTTDGDTIEPEDYTIQRKSQYSDNIYDYDLREDLSELFYNYKTDLHEYEIYKINLV